MLRGLLELSSTLLLRKPIKRLRKRTYSFTRPRLSLNASTTHQYLGRGFLITGCFVYFISGCTTNPVTGRGQFTLLPEAQVVEASSQAYVAQMNDYKKKGELTADPNTIARVKQITNRLIAKATTIHPESKNWKWEVNVVNEPQVNAFAMAGGKIAVYTGLIEKINPTDDELAEVLAHEIGHALAGHTREKMSVSMGTELALAAYSTKAALDEKTQQALAAGALVAIQLPNSRHMESEADRLGIELAARAGYNPDAALSLWQKMGKLQSGSSPPEFLSTHPSDETRLHALSELVPQMKPIYLAAKQ